VTTEAAAEAVTAEAAETAAAVAETVDRSANAGD
jgi:hypothetical protein